VAAYSDDLVYKFLPDGKQSVFKRGLATPAGLTIDNNGFLYIATWGDGAIYQIEK
jgi:sugar lactone lactonase YvrE